MSEESPLVVVLFEAQWTVADLRKHLEGAHGPGVLLVVSPEGWSIDEGGALSVLRSIRTSFPGRSYALASKNQAVLRIAKQAGWGTMERVHALKGALKRHPFLEESVRTFSPGFWRSNIRSQLQSLGLLSLPKVRIWVLLFASAGVFFFIFFRLLPSATVYVWPGEETVTQTVNVYLVASGAVVPAERVRTLMLYPLTVEVERTLTFDEIGQEFTGTNAEMVMTIVNDASEQFSLREGTRFTNQAGMVFRLSKDVIIPARSSVNERVIADDVDLYDEIIGERGNVPAGLKWEIPGLPRDDRILVYGRNEQAGVGGTTSSENVLHEEDLMLAQKTLESQLMITARQLIDEERILKNEREEGASYVELRYEELTRTVYDNLRLPTEFLGQNVTSAPVSGRIRFTVLLYDENALFSLLRKELMDILSEEKVLVTDSVAKQNLVLHVIDAPWDADRFDWVKVTVDLSAKQRYELDPLTPTGALFSKQVREAVAGKSVSEAQGIVRNFPEVAKVEISVWPPWSGVLPGIASNILVSEEE